MKLMIDIPEEDYKFIKKQITDGISNPLKVYIANGVPTEQKPILDRIIAEMEELTEWHDCPIELDNGNDAWYCEAVNRCIGIVDKYRQEG